MVGVSGIRKDPDHPSIRTTPLPTKKKKRRNPAWNLKAAETNPFEGKLKNKKRINKSNKIFQLKRKKKNSNENLFVCPHQCQVAILEECPKAGRGVCLVYEVQLSSFPVTVKLDSRTSWFMVTHGCKGAFSLVLLHGLLSGPSVQGGTIHGALCRSFSRTAGGSESYVFSGCFCTLLYATAATTAATAAADWVTVALLTVPAGLGALQDACGCLLLCLIHVAALLLGATWHLPLVLLDLLTWACTRLGLGAARWFCGEQVQTGFNTHSRVRVTLCRNPLQTARWPKSFTFRRINDWFARLLTHTRTYTNTQLDLSFNRTCHIRSHRFTKWIQCFLSVLKRA